MVSTHVPKISIQQIYSTGSAERKSNSSDRLSTVKKL